MLSFSEAQLNTWLGTLIFPLARLLGLFSAAPPFNDRSLPLRVRVAAGVMVTLALIANLPPVTAPAPGSGVGLVILAQQVLIGLALGFVLQLSFAALEVAGEVMALQMGLGFAVFYDPSTAGQSPVLGQFIVLLATLVFLAIDGHLMMIALLGESFKWLPINDHPFPAAALHDIVRGAALMFAAGVMLALPMIAALLVVNIALAVLTRAAPQLNLFAVGFPVTLAAGFAMVLLLMNYLAPALVRLFEQGLRAVGQFAQATA
ncbi:MAG: flagellar biosynthetic protein FliR [Rhodocyclaceae bacterium]|nr:flagellar biosynthetic protein FliR [Rhodocyclaceae bacterium]MBX3668650.1 flagellar biosynthetic protein FliR [Rhodocyclaceae bacterium]